MNKKGERGGERTGSKPSLQFSRINLALAAGAVVTITLGYWLLSSGSITWAPILLVLGYVFLVPLAIIL